MSKHIAQSMKTKIALAFVVSMTHVALTIQAVAWTSQWGADAALATTWAMTMLPGIVLTLLVPSARRHWWRWPLTWALMYVTVGDVGVLVMLVGHAWTGVLVMGDVVGQGAEQPG